MKNWVAKGVGALGCITTIVAYYLALVGIIKLFFK
jgi:hypothetical protein